MRNLTLFALLWANFITCFSQPTDNVVAYYPFNKNADDVSGHSKHGTVTGASLTTDRLGKPNAAYFFNGYNNVILLPNALLPQSNAYAISCWVKPLGNNTSPDTDNSQYIIDLRGQYQIALGYKEPLNTPNPNTSWFYIYSYPDAVSQSVYAPANSMMPGNWFHLLCNYGNNVMEYYLNGSFVGSVNVNPATTVYGYNNTIGKDYNMGRDRLWFYGAIDEVLFYSRKLTSSEVQAIYNRGLVSSEIAELYAPVSIRYNYDISGNRGSRAPITLKSGSFINEPDSVGSVSFNENYLEPQKEEIEGGRINIYPNPTRGFLKVEITGVKEEVKTSIQIFSLSGSKVIDIVPETSTSVIDLSNYPNGTYLLRVRVGEKITEWKIIKE